MGLVFVHAAVTAAAALGRRLCRLRRRTSPPSWLVGALRRLRALALAPSLASDYSSTQRAAVSTTSCAARSSSAGARQVEERVRSQSSEFRAYISQKRQADQESPHGAAPSERRHPAVTHPNVRMHMCNKSRSPAGAATTLPAEGSPSTRLGSPSYAAAAAQEGSNVWSSSPS